MYRRTKSYEGTRSKEVEDRISAIKEKLKEMFPDLYKNPDEFKKKAYFIAKGMPNAENIFGKDGPMSDLEAIATEMNQQIPLPGVKPLPGLPYNAKPKNDAEFAEKVQTTGVVDLNYLMKSVKNDINELDKISKSEKLVVPQQPAAPIVPGQQAYVQPVKPLPPGCIPAANIIRPMPANMAPPSVPQLSNFPQGTVVTQNNNNVIIKPPVQLPSIQPVPQNSLSPLPASMAPPGAVAKPAPKPASVQQNLMSDVAQAVATRRKKMDDDEKKLQEFAKH